jgi:predicted NBD/HSP70 family sugar kinase
MTRYAVGIDVGGTKIAAGIVDQDGTVLACRQTRAHSERERVVVRPSGAFGR